MIRVKQICFDETGLFVREFCFTDNPDLKPLLIFDLHSMESE